MEEELTPGLLCSLHFGRWCGVGEKKGGRGKERSELLKNWEYNC
jgi:hypothetical protein